MENKTLQDFKNQLTKEKYNGLDYDFVFGAILKGDSRISIIEFTQNMDKASERYASHVAEKACRKQREICAEEAKIYTPPAQSPHSPNMLISSNSIDWDNVYKTDITIDKDSILNAPLAIENK